MERFGEVGEPRSDVVVPELFVVVFAEGALNDEEGGEVVGGEGIVGGREGEEALIDHELNTAGDFVRLLLEPSGSASGDYGVEDKEAAEFHGGILVVLFIPVTSE